VPGSFVNCCRRLADPAVAATLPGPRTSPLRLSSSLGRCLAPYWDGLLVIVPPIHIPLLFHISLLLCAQFPLAPDLPRDATADGVAFLELRTDRSTCYVHEPIDLQFRFGIESRFRRDNLLPLFQSPLCLSVQLEAPWIDSLSGATARPSPASGSCSFVLNDAPANAREVDDARIDARELDVFELRRTYLADHAGPFEVPEARLRFAYATRFGDDSLAGRVAQDRVVAYVRSAPVALTILPLPEEGRPAGFCGAVGRLSLRGELGAGEVEQGSSVRLVLRVTGEGNLAQFDAPRLALDGWRASAAGDTQGVSERTLEYDLVPLSPLVTSVPRVPFAYFDTTAPAGYRTLYTGPFPVQVRASAPEEVRHDPPYDDQLNPWFVGFLCALAAGLCAGVAARLHRRRRRSASLE
jgi:hypothetical protein